MTNRSEDMRALLDQIKTIKLNESEPLNELNDLPNSTGYEFAKWGFDGSSAKRDRSASVTVQGNAKTRLWLQANGEELGVTFTDKKSLFGPTTFVLTGPARVVNKVAKTLEDMGLGKALQPTMEGEYEDEIAARGSAAKAMANQVSQNRAARYAGSEQATLTVHAGAMVRRGLRRLLDRSAASYGVTYKEEKGLLDSQFVISGPTHVLRALEDTLRKATSDEPQLESEECGLEERAPHNAKAERFIKKHKSEFKKRYGADKGESVLYATAWKKFGENDEADPDGKELLLGDKEPDDYHQPNADAEIVDEGKFGKAAKVAAGIAAAGAIGAPLGQIAKQGIEYHRGGGHSSDHNISMSDARTNNAWNDAVKAVKEEEIDPLDQDIQRPETFTGPSVWASYLVNGDASGLNPEEKEAADKWLAGIAPYRVVDVARDENGEGLEPRFTWSYDLYGGTAKGGDVIDYVAMKPQSQAPVPGYEPRDNGDHLGGNVDMRV